MYEVTALKSVPFFSELSTEHLAQLAQACRRLELDANQLIFRAGDAPDGLYVLLAGKVRIYRHDDEGNEVDLAFRETGSFFGEIALLENRPRTATVVTLAPSELLILDQSTFMDLLLHARAQVVFHVFTALSRIVRENVESLWKQELAQQALRAELEVARYRSLAQMVAGVAHELNTPLGVANTAVGMINSRLRSELWQTLAQNSRPGQELLADVREAAELTTRNIARAHRLVQTFKQISVSQLTERLESVGLLALLQEVVDLFKLNAREARLAISIASALPPSADAWRGSPGQLTQVILNLLTNIERYAYPGGDGRVEIAASATQLNKAPAFAIAVRDWGRGIAPEHLPRVFEPFFTTGRGSGGTGLGMAIAQSLVTEALAGTIRIESALGKGTVVTVVVPAITAEPSAS
jgi:signal transduction histidine kinase